MSVTVPAILPRRSRGCIIGAYPRNSTGPTGIVRLEIPKIVTGDLKNFDVCTEQLWVYDLNNLALADGADRGGQWMIPGTFKAQAFRVLGQKAGMPVVELTSWGLKTGTTKVCYEINRNFGYANALSANSPGGYLIRGDTYQTTTTLTLVTDVMTGIPGPGKPATAGDYGVVSNTSLAVGTAGTAGWCVARGDAERFKGGLQRSTRVYLMTGGPTSGTWY